ncbi:MAG: hypothetical protein ACLQLO_22110, partial [Mycobacterium sp.]
VEERQRVRGGLRTERHSSQQFSSPSSSCSAKTSSSRASSSVTALSPFLDLRYRTPHHLALSNDQNLWMVLGEAA